MSVLIKSLATNVYLLSVARIISSIKHAKDIYLIPRPYVMRVWRLLLQSVSKSMPI